MGDSVWLSVSLSWLYNGPVSSLECTSPVSLCQVGQALWGSYVSQAVKKMDNIGCTCISVISYKPLFLKKKKNLISIKFKKMSTEC